MIFTVEKRPFGWEVVEGKSDHAREQWSGGGVLVFVKGSMTIKEYSVVANIAMNHILSQGRSLKGLYRSGGSK